MILLLNNHGHSDAAFNEYLQRASQFFAEQLIHKQLLRHVVVEIKFNKHLDNFGYTSIVGRNSKGKPRNLLIELHPFISGVEILKTLAHEFVHVKQFVYEELNEEQTMWQGKKYDAEEVDYYSLPWEIEAMGLEVGLFIHYAKKEALWNVFEGVKDPDRLIKPEPIGWLNEDKFSETKRKTPAAESQRFDIEDVPTSHRKRREEHIDGSTGRRRTAFRSWLKSFFLSS